MKIFILFLGCVMCSSTAFSQNYFQKIWGDSLVGEEGNAVHQLADGSIYVLGSTNDGIYGGSDVSITKLDANGNILWAQLYGTQDDDAPANFAYKDGVFVVVGETFYPSSSADSDAFLFRIDTAGNLLGFKNYGVPTKHEQYNNLSPEADGGWVVAGFVSDASGSNNAYIVRFDGTDWDMPYWEKDYGGANVEIGCHVLPTSDGGYIVVGDQMQHTGRVQIYVLKLDSIGDFIWDYTVPFDYNGGSKSAIINSENQLVIIGEAATATSNFFDIYFTRMRTDLPILLWHNTIPASDRGDAGFAICERTPNDYVVTGYGFDTTTNDMDVVLMSLDSLGSEVDKLLLGTPNYDMATGLYPAIGGGFLIAGAAGGQYFLAYQNVANTPTSIITTKNSRSEYAFYPNPAQDWLQLPDIAQAARVLVYDNKGALLRDVAYTPFFGVMNLQEGVYIIQLTDSNYVPLMVGKVAIGNKQ